VERWRERIADGDELEIMTTIQQIATQGHEIEGTGRYPDCLYYAHPAYPSAFVVVPTTGGGIHGAAITCLTAAFFEEVSAAHKRRTTP
jgi:hypothetical protein